MEPGSTTPPSAVPPTRCDRCRDAIDGAVHYVDGRPLCAGCAQRLRAADRAARDRARSEAV